MGILLIFVPCLLLPAPAWISSSGLRRSLWEIHAKPPVKVAWSVCGVPHIKGLKESHGPDCFICYKCVSLLRAKGLCVTLSAKGKELSQPLPWSCAAEESQPRTPLVLCDLVHLPSRLTHRCPGLCVATVVSLCTSVLGSHSNWVHAGCITHKRFLLHWKFVAVFPETAGTVMWGYIRSSTSRGGFISVRPV